MCGQLPERISVDGSLPKQDGIGPTQNKKNNVGFFIREALQLEALSYIEISFGVNNFGGYNFFQ